MEREIAPSSAAPEASTFQVLTAIHSDRDLRPPSTHNIGGINKANNQKIRPSCIVPIPCASRALPQLPRFKTLPQQLRQRNRAASLAKAASVSYNTSSISHFPIYPSTHLPIYPFTPSRPNCLHHPTRTVPIDPCRRLIYNHLRWCRPCFPQADCRCLRARSVQEALAAGQNGEECHAQHGACRSRENGSRCKAKLASFSIRPKLTVTHSNNYQSGEKPAMTTFRMSRISLGS